MFTNNPFASVNALSSPALAQTYLVLMILAVIRATATIADRGLSAGRSAPFHLHRARRIAAMSPTQDGVVRAGRSREAVPNDAP